MSRLYDYNKNVWVDAEDHEVTNLVASGDYGFEAGMSIPVVDPKTGELGYMPSENAYEAFRAGDYQWATKDAVNNWEAGGKLAIQKKHYDDDLLASVAGGLRGFTFGLSDLAATEIAGPLTGQEDEIRAGLNALREVNPDLSLVTEIGGSLVNPAGLAGSGSRAVAAGAGAISKASAAGLATKLGAEATEAALRAGAGQAVSKIGGMAAEGAIFGLGQGITEAALGPAEGVVDNLMIVGEGALAGGLFGAGFGGLFQGGRLAKQAIDDVTGKAVAKVDELAASATDKGVALTAVLSPKHRDQINAVRAGLADDPNIIRVYREGGLAAAEKAGKEIVALEKEMAKEAMRVGKDFTKFLQRAGDDEAEIIRQAATNAGNDLYKAMGDLHKDQQGRYADYWRSLVNMRDPAKVASKAINIIDDKFDKMKKLAIKSKSAEMRSFLEKFDQEVRGYFQVPSIGGVAKDTAEMTYQQRLDRVAAAMTEGSEVQALNGLKQWLDGGLGRGGRTTSGKRISEIAAAVPKEFRDEVGDLVHAINGMLKGHPNQVISQAQKQIDNGYRAYSSLKKYVTETLFNKKSGLPKSTMVEHLIDPDAAAPLENLMNKFEEFVPNIEAIKNAKTLKARRIANTEFMRKVDELSNLTPDQRLADDVVADFIGDIKDADLIGRLNQVRKFTEAAAQQVDNPNVIDKYIQLKSALGQASEIPEEMLKLVGKQKSLGAVKALDEAGAGKDKSVVEQLLGFKRSVIPGGGTKSVIGGMVAGPAGAAVGAGLDVLSAVRNDPMKIINGIVAVRDASMQGAHMLQTAIEKTGQALTSKTTERVAGRVTTSDYNKKAHENRRKKYRQVAKRVQEFASNPAAVLDQMEARIGAFDSTPGVQQQLGTKMAMIGSFLAQKAPQNPLGPEQTLFVGPEWEPSDEEIGTFERYAETAFNPLAAVGRVADGTLTHEDVEALKTIWPDVYNQLHDHLMNVIMESGSKIPYDRRITLGVLFGVDADPAMTGDALVDWQAKYTTDQGGRPETRLRGKFTTNPMETVATEVDRVENRGLA